MREKRERERGKGKRGESSSSKGKRERRTTTSCFLLRWAAQQGKFYYYCLLLAPVLFWLENCEYGTYGMVQYLAWYGQLAL